MSRSIRTLSADINEANITLSADQLYGLHQTLVMNMDQGKRIGDVFGYTLNTILYKEFSKADSKPGRSTSVKVTPQMANAINQILDADVDNLRISKDDESYIRSKVSRLVEGFEMINEGMFSWKTQDTNMAISAYRDGRQTVYMIDDKGNIWEEDAYEGYGEFGGKDYYELLDQMNGGPGDRKNGIDLAFGPLERKDGKPVLFPALVHNKKYNWKRHDFTKEPESDPKQGMPAKKYWTGSRPQYEAMKTNTSILTEDFKDVSNKFKEALDDLADSKFNDKDIEALIKKYKEKRPDAAMAYAKKAFGWLWKESVDVNEGRSIPKIQKEWGKIVDDMRATVVSWKEAEGQEKEDLLAKLKDLTAQKKKLEAELNDAVGLKDADAELVGEEKVNELSVGTYRDTVKAGIERGDSKGEKIATRALESFAKEVLKELASQEFIIKAGRGQNQAVAVANEIRRGDNKNQFNQFKLVFTGEGSMINNKNIKVFGSDEVHFNAKAIIYLPDTFGGWSSDFTLRGYQQHNHVPVQTLQFSIKNGSVFVYFRAADTHFEFTRPGARMLAQLGDKIAQELEFPTPIKHNSIKQFDAMPISSNEGAQFVSESYDELNERVVTLKRRYTESHPATTAGMHASVRNRMLEAIADGKLTKEEFDAVLKETSKNSAKWLRRNALYFNVSEDGITLSKFGKRALSQIRINEATDMKLFESFEQFVASNKLDEARETWVVYTKPKNNPLRMDFYSDHTSKKSAEDMIEILSTKVRNNNWDGFGMMTRSDWDKMVGDKYAFEGNLYEAYVELDAMDPESKDLQKFLKKHNVELEIIDMGGPDYGAYWVRLEGKKRDLEIVLADDELGWGMAKRDMEIEEAINWDTIELNEAFKSSKLSALLDLRGMSKQVMKGIYGFTKAKLDEITDDQLVELTPQEAYKSKRPNALFFYIVDNEKENPYADRDAWRETKVIPGNTLIAVADGNNKFYGVDYGSRWGKDRQMTLSTKDSDGIGINKKYRGYDASGLYNVKRIADVADRVLVFDWSLMPSASDERMQRSAAKKGAIAFMSDRDFKAQNMARYKEILGQKASKLPLDKIVEDAINEITKQIADGIKANNLTKYGELILGTSSNGREVNTRDASNAMGNILNAYSNYVRSSVEVESAKKNGWSGEYDQRNMQENAKVITDLVKKIKTMDYGW